MYEPVPSSAKEPDLTSSPTERVTGRDSPVRIASSRLKASADSSCPSATIWSPGASRTRSPFTSSSTCAFLTRPSRTTDAVGCTSAARRSRVRFARTLLGDPDRRVGDQDAEEERVPPVAEEQCQRPEDDQDQVEDGEDVGPDDARVGAARLKGRERPA